MKNRRDKCWKPTLQSEKILLALTVVCILIIIALIIGLVLSSPSSDPETCNSKACLEAASTLLSDMDPDVDPCTDFYEYACGSYANKVNLLEKLIPDSDHKKGSETTDQIMKIITQPGNSINSKHRKLLRDFYFSCMNISLIEELRATPLLDTVKQLGGWPILPDSHWNEQRFQFAQTLITFRNLGIDINMFFKMDVDVDVLQHGTYTIFFEPPKLKLPDLSNYQIREKYLNFMTTIATLLGAEAAIAERDMQEVLEFETKLAEAAIPTENARDYSEMIFKIPINELNQLMPQISWVEFIRNMAPTTLLSSLDTVTVMSPSVLKQISNLLHDSKKRTIANFMLWTFVKTHCNLLNGAIADICFKFNSDFLGQSDFPLRKFYCDITTARDLELAASAVFVKNIFDTTRSKIELTKVVDNLRNELHNSFTTSEWMDSETKKKAIDKVEKMKQYVCYPDELLDDSKVDTYYGSLTLNPHNYFHNKLLAKKFADDKMFDKLNKKPEEIGWVEFGAGVWVPNAQFRQPANRIEIMAGNLAGDFHPDYPSYLNYAGVGTVIGHELIHGFDDQGKQLDSEGVVNNWWTNKSEKLFREKADMVVKLYSNFKVPEINKNINGDLVQAESISDIEGVKLAYKTFRNLEKESRNEVGLPGLKLTNKQLFWIKLANSYCASYSKEKLMHQILTDEHPPNKYRVYGMIMNSKDFSQDFNCPVNSPMNPSEKISFYITK